MNAVLQWTELLPRPTRRRVAAAGSFDLDLAALLNRLRRAELDVLADRLELDPSGRIGRLRARLWLAGAELEAGGRDYLGTALQPAPIVLGERLVYQGQVRGKMPPATAWPRPIPPAVPLPENPSEPATLEALLGAADALVGVELGSRGRDKGEYGSRVAALLGVVEHGRSEPDWRGVVELKTVPVMRDPSGLWRVKEDPAVAMENAAPHCKLERVLWIARVADDERSAVLSWYYQERDATIARLCARDLHTRPKGPAGARTRGWYLHKRFFLDSGFLASLNG